jgi:mitochondrial inner membrane protease ATP23
MLEFRHSTPSPAAAERSDDTTGAVKAEDLYSAHDVCESAVEYVLRNVNTVQYMIKSIEDITGIPFRRDRIKCLPLVPHQRAAHDAAGLTPDRVFAGYMWRSARSDCKAKDVVLLEDHIIRLFNTKHAQAFLKKKREAEANRGGAPPTSSLPASSPSPDTSSAASSSLLQQLLGESQQAVLHQVERNIRHELIHAFDDARGVIESSDCLHQACSEIRAARLSGDCFVGQEMRKGRFNFFDGGQKCVRRRAVMAVERNPVCRGFSERAVDTVMTKCYSDYEPFAAPVYSLGSYGDAMFPNGTLKL